MKKVIVDVTTCPYCGNGIGMIKDGNWAQCLTCMSEVYIGDEEFVGALQDVYELLMNYDFDGAEQRYFLLSRQAEDNSNFDAFAAAEWGRLLARLGVIFKVNALGEYGEPIFARYDKHIKSVLDLDSYKNIQDSDISDSVKKAYADAATALDKRYQVIASSVGLPTNNEVFIASNMSDSDLYKLLDVKGVKAYVVSEEYMATEDEGEVLAMLLRSDVLVIEAENKKGFHRPFIEAKWRLWLDLIKYNIKAKDSLIVLYLGEEPYLPERLKARNTPIFTFDELTTLVDSLGITKKTEQEDGEVELSGTWLERLEVSVLESVKANLADDIDARFAKYESTIASLSARVHDLEEEVYYLKTRRDTELGVMNFDMVEPVFNDDEKL